MKTLVVYYSLGGNTRLMAENIAEAVKADLLELKLKKEFKGKGFMKYFWGGKQVLMGEKPELKAFDKDPTDYEMIFIGTPVWATSYAPALATFFDKVKLKNKKIALFCCYRTSVGKTFKKMEEKLKGNEILGEVGFLEPLKINKSDKIKKVINWAKKTE